MRFRKTGIVIAALGGLRILAWSMGVTWLALAPRDRTIESPLPTYRLEIGASPGVEGESGGPVRISPDSTLSVTLVPAVAVAGPVVLRAFLMDPGRTRARAWTAHFDRDESGALSLRARVRDLPGIGPGRVHLLFLLGRTGAMPVEPTSCFDGWTRLDADLEIAPL